MDDFETMGPTETLWTHKTLFTGTKIYLISERTPTEEVSLYLRLVKEGQSVYLYGDDVGEFFNFLDQKVDEFTIKDKELHNDVEIYDFDDYALLVLHETGATLQAYDGLVSHTVTSEIELTRLELAEITTMSEEVFSITKFARSKYCQVWSPALLLPPQMLLGEQNRSRGVNQSS